jgi:hypothetical protein
LLKALVQFHFDKQASELQQKFSDILSDIEKSIPDIWNDETNDNSNQPVSYFTCIYITYQQNGENKAEETSIVKNVSFYD